jgi:hypothetical protein
MNKWFNEHDLNKKHNPIVIPQLKGLVLPHAGTRHIGHIMSHTLRFRPKLQNINKIVVFFLPSNKNKSIDSHEYQIPINCIRELWGDQFEFIPFNIFKKNTSELKQYKLNLLNKDHDNFSETFFILSVDFSHFKPYQNALQLEKCASQSVLYQKFNLPCSSVIDDKRTFLTFLDLFPNTYDFRWVGRSMSVNKRGGVGYLSYLILPKLTQRDIRRDIRRDNKIDGVFVTAHDTKMNSRECLGKWFHDTNKWTKKKEDELIRDVLTKARQTSRLTGGMALHIPVKYYTITYLYTDYTSRDFIRGWHSIKGNGAFYLSDVMLENTYENGKWIKNTNASWVKPEKNGIFNVNYTLKKLRHKAKNKTYKYKNNKNITSSYYQLYTSKNIFVMTQD